MRELKVQARYRAMERIGDGDSSAPSPIVYCYAPGAINVVGIGESPDHVVVALERQQDAGPNSVGSSVGGEQVANEHNSPANHAECRSQARGHIAVRPHAHCSCPGTLEILGVVEVGNENVAPLY